MALLLLRMHGLAHHNRAGFFFFLPTRSTDRDFIAVESSPFLGAS
jgi:hypothetical protein